MSKALENYGEKQRLEGRAEGRVEGRAEGAIETARKMISRGKLTLEEIAEDSDSLLPR